MAQESAERTILVFKIRCDQAEVAPCSRVGRRSGGSSLEEGGIFLVFLIHSAARCSASSNCSIVIVLLTWFLARLICSFAMRNHIYANTKSFGPVLRAE